MWKSGTDANSASKYEAIAPAPVHVRSGKRSTPSSSHSSRRPGTSWAFKRSNSVWTSSEFVAIAAAYPRPRSGTGLVPHPVFKTGCPS